MTKKEQQRYFYQQIDERYRWICKRADELFPVPNSYYKNMIDHDEKRKMVLVTRAGIYHFDRQFMGEFPAPWRPIFPE